MIIPPVVKALCVVLPADTLVLPVAGISRGNTRADLGAGASGFGIGSALYKPGTPADVVKQNAIEVIAAYAGTISV